MENALQQHVLTKVISAVRGSAPLSSLPISGSTRFVEDLGFDSLDLVEVAITIEEMFDIELTRDDMGGFADLSDMTAYLSRRFFQDVEARPLARAA